MVDFSLHFPPGFQWGTATAAHPVEGGHTDNNWAAWEKAPGRVYQDEPAGRACEWWNGRHEEDFDRAASLHNNALRLSIDWGRVEPEPSRIDWRALERYAAILEALRARGLEPLVTLHHFSQPQWVEQAGGWTNEDTARHFGDFVEVVVSELGHLIRLWCTINAPVTYAVLSHLTGRFPPGQRSAQQTMRAIENLLRGHARAYHTIKDALPGAQVGLAKQQISFVTQRPGWLHAPARAAVHRIYNRAFIDALQTGMLRLPLHRVEVPAARDSLDWIGLNYFSRFAAGFNPLRPKQLFLQHSQPRAGSGEPHGAGEIWPEGLLDHLKWLHRRTDLPLYVTANGVPAEDDALRRLFLVRSARSLWQATMHSLPVRGYFYWTLVDHFEWADGYDPRHRFGLFRCDPETQQRTKRPSADLYRAICGANALTSEMVQAYVPNAADELFPAPPVQAEVEWIQRG